VGGENTILQTMKAIRPGGVVSMVGFLGGGGKSESPPSFSLIQRQLCIVRGMNVGPRRMFRDMNAFLEEHNIKPIVSDRTFNFAEAREAYKEMEKQEFWGKIVIQVQ
jgi:D-arabinose 1-dehydrogenase-like Zn-dependent alcohol dehydrogenase